MASTSYSSNFSTFHNETSSSNFQQSSRNRSNPPNFSYQSSTSQFKVPSTLKHFANAPSLFGPSNPHIEPKIEESYIGNLSNKPNYYGNSITFTRLTSSLNAPTIWQKCQEIESSIERLTTEQEFNDFREFFPILLGNIFGTDRGNSWIDCIVSDRDSISLIRLLSPTSSLFGLILKFCHDENISFVFLQNFLPERVKRILEVGDNQLIHSLPNFYNIKGNAFIQNRKNIQINLNIFLYYFFSFAHYAVNNFPRVLNKPFGVYQNQSETTYLMLLDLYLQFFIPKDNFAGMFSLGYQFLQILVEFWLNQNHFDPHHKAPEYLTNEYTIPTQQSLLALSKLVNHMSYFSSLASNNMELLGTVSPQRIEFVSPSHVAIDFHNVLQKPLYAFLFLAFTRSPLDTKQVPLSLIIDLWLTYIQPWRDSEISYDSLPFIEENFPFYIRLFNLMIRLVLEFYIIPDVLSSFEKVIDFFSQNDLLNMIREIDSLLTSFLQKDPTFNPNQVPKVNLIWARYRHVTLETEYDSLWSPENLTPAFKLIDIIKKQEESKSRVVFSDTVSPSKKDPFSNILSWIFKTNQSSTYFTSTRSNEFHRQSRLSELMCTIFGVDLDQAISAVREESSQNENNFNVRQESKLSEREILIQQKMNRRILVSSKKNIEYRGDPSLRPICSYENRRLVRWLHKLSNFLNSTPLFQKFHIHISLRFLASYYVLAYILLFIIIWYMVSASDFFEIFPEF